MHLKNSHLLTECAYRLKLAMQDLWTALRILADVERVDRLAKAFKACPKQHEKSFLRWFHSKHGEWFA
ncbi:hypothetical protein [Paenibacillus polymyxa]|uniref:hypothetical protein n=1 Tax=Paenibacillus polymyxa TaxID=1406 RepID=UPI00058A3607|nr:hypothetical protein [Paenibacillus polymyxa]AJE51457.1 hypothetical protein RE92_10595 [Paenibacillus polymyxa]QOH60129.1 hypothetical protein DI243_01115 [Paenibacillus polymyxa]